MANPEQVEFLEKLVQCIADECAAAIAPDLPPPKFFFAAAEPREPSTPGVEDLAKIFGLQET